MGLVIEFENAGIIEGRQDLIKIEPMGFFIDPAFILISILTGRLLR
jgi:hypothetical protein